MNGIDGALLELVRKSAVEEERDDFRRDGLLHCGRCGTARECRIEFDGVPVVVGCMCQCRTEESDAKQRQKERLEQFMSCQRLRAQGIQDPAVRQCTFSAAKGTKRIAQCQAYASRWEQMREQNAGLVFWGPPDGGKTYAAACIANALIDRGVPALMTSFPMILNSGWDKAEIVRQMKRFPLLVLDDLGIERESGYAMETVYFVIDERYKSRMPLIITTNLTLEELRRPKDIRFKRIYSRILEMCVPVHFEEQRMREEKAADKMRFAREVFG